ncbi:hypothetical protein DPMN_087454 [Dreissena polymorpha]|uniref:Uncharacterized protein n=1 Tax=Dreissena polymorpha TaxID=45954 RepID=A0A9D4KT79_DREPO|nr:hypothetical protein DPMN_087454 [Dreissena polymorpha]
MLASYGIVRICRAMRLNLEPRNLSRSAAGVCTSRPGRESPAEDFLEDFEESLGEMVIVRRWIVVSLHRLRRVGKGNFCGRLCKSSEFRYPSTRTSSPADFADSQNVEGSPSVTITEVSQDGGTEYALRAGETVLVKHGLWRLERPYNRRSVRGAERSYYLIVSTPLAE